MIRYLGRKILQAMEMADVARPASGRIIEPFAGSAAFSRIFGEKGLVDKAIIGDVSPRVANLQRYVASSPEKLLSKFQDVVKPITGKTEPEDIPYLKELWEQSKSAEGIDKAAIDLVLGNYSRSYNPERTVPRFTPGKYATPEGIARKVRSLSEVTGEGEVLNSSFEKTLGKAKSGDFIVVDPPYPESTGYKTSMHEYAPMYSKLNEILSDLKSSTSGVVYTNKEGAAAFPGLKFKPRKRTSYMGEHFATWGKDWNDR